MKNKTLPIKKTKVPESKVWLEHYSLNYEWVRVDIVVDYQKMDVSLVDNARNKKEYWFAWRSLSYEKWWYTIVDAIKSAMQFGFDKLRIREEENNKDVMLKTAGIMWAMDK